MLLTIIIMQFIVILVTFLGLFVNVFDMIIVDLMLSFTT